MRELQINTLFVKRSIFLLFTFYFLLFFTGCDSGSDKSAESLRICPECNMPLPKSNLHTSSLNDNGKIHYFDDVGCMVLWSKENNVELKNMKIFSNDTKKYIDASKAFYSINERTPMNYGFAAYEKKNENTIIDFNEVKLRMLRGEHMANPKIRKKILGY